MNRQKLFAATLIGVCGLFQVGVDAADSDAISKVELVRDRWGIANVYADTDEAAMFGIGWAAAEDRAFQMYLNVRTMQGRSAEVRGNVTSERDGSTTVERDRRNRILRVFQRAAAVVPNLDDETRRMLVSYSAGVNGFMQSHPQRLSPMFEKTGLIPEPWTPAHCVAAVWDLAFHFGNDGLGDLETLHEYQAGNEEGRQPNTAIDFAANVQRADVSDEWVQKTWDYVQSKGVEPDHPLQAPTPSMSHAWVVGKQRSTTGSAILHSDPQMQVCNPSQMYSFHISGRTFNARGVGVAGSPWILIGFTPNVAWGVTAMGLDHADLFLLKTDSEHPNQYEFDGEWRDVQTFEETILVRGGEAVEFERHETHMGPVVTSLADDVRDGEHVVLISVPLSVDDRDPVQALLPMIRAGNVDELDAATWNWTFPTANMLMGDSEGNIGYRSLGALPLRSAQAKWHGRAAQSGWKSEHLWREIVPHELMPHCKNPGVGWLGSANHRPIASFYPIPSGLTMGGFGGRARRLYERLKALDRFSPQDVLDVHYDTVNPIKRDVARLGYYIRDKMQAGLSNEAEKSLQHLESWYAKGAKMDNRIPGTDLMKMIPRKLNSQFRELAETFSGDEYRDAGDELGLWFDIVFRQMESTTKALTDDEVRFVDTILSNAWRAALETYGPDPSKWHSAAVELHRQKLLPYYQDLAGFPTLDPNFDLPEPDLHDNEQLTMLSQQGQTYSQSVSLHDPDSAVTLEPVGPSERPASPYRLSTYQLWAEGEFHAAPLSRDAVDQIATQWVDLSAEYAKAQPE